MFLQERLLEVFTKRPKRFVLIEQGMKILGVQAGERWIEVGCNTGEAIVYMNDKQGLKAAGVDSNQRAIEIGKAEHPGINLLCATAQDMPFDDKSIDGILSEAAWSPLTDKGGALQEYVRVLKQGGHIIINDFTLKPSADMAFCDGYMHIPCFAGIDTLDGYRQYFEKAEFECVRAAKEADTLVSLTFHLMKECNIKADEIGPLLSCWGKDRIDGCNTCGKDNVSDNKRKNDVIRNAGLSFGQLLLRKK